MVWTGNEQGRCHGRYPQGIPNVYDFVAEHLLECWLFVVVERR